jgi:flavin reductase (DIM6/NTAB) family NADH-FMN oxidoreductase RutF
VTRAAAGDRGRAVTGRDPEETAMTPDLRLVTDPAAGFTDAMGALAAGVALVTSRVDGRPWGLTVTSFVSVSADPPTVLVSLGSETISTGAITATRRFGVSLLAEQQVGLARLCSAPGAPKFIEPYVEADHGDAAAPVVADALAHLDCELSEAIRIADHTLLVGLVRAARSSRAGAPLLYHRRGYRRANERTVTCLSS